MNPTKEAKSIKTILIVEDELMQAKILQTKIEQSNHRCLLAKTGEEGLRLLQENDKHDLIILDLILPKKNGYDVLEELRNTIKSDIPVIVLSNRNQEADVCMAMNLGANEYVHKAEISLKDLATIINKYLTNLE